jgi:hypothetical protein
MSRVSYAKAHLFEEEDKEEQQTFKKTFQTYSARSCKPGALLEFVLKFANLY